MLLIGGCRSMARSHARTCARHGVRARLTHDHDSCRTRGSQHAMLILSERGRWGHCKESLCLVCSVCFVSRGGVFAEGMSDMCACSHESASFLTALDNRRLLAAQLCKSLSDRGSSLPKLVSPPRARCAYRSERLLPHQPSRSTSPGMFSIGQREKVHFLLHLCLQSVGTALSRGQTLNSRREPCGIQ